MTLSPNGGGGWQMAGATATLVVSGPISPGQMTAVTILLRAGDAFDRVVNAVEIVSAQDSSGTVQADADAVNDAVSGNDPVIDNALDGDGVNDEDDHDIVAFFVDLIDVALAKRLTDVPVSRLQPILCYAWNNCQRRQCATGQRLWRSVIRKATI